MIFNDFCFTIRYICFYAGPSSPISGSVYKTNENEKKINAFVKICSDETENTHGQYIHASLKDIRTKLIEVVSMEKDSSIWFRNRED